MDERAGGGTTSIIFFSISLSLYLSALGESIFDFHLCLSYGRKGMGRGVAICGIESIIPFFYICIT
ncbi:hypothetical protein F4775DRAFT_534666 [Biscogniauxia sp. FL1348]|nr:hypothetical protein F4775DRAFT_534666 [Biscogniauxia sp. FL1348]